MRLLIFLFFTSSLIAVEHLPEEYTVSFGNPEAPIKIIEYFSFTCPNCVSLFRKDFQDIKKKYLNTQKVHLTFHPIPMDLITIQAMDCLSKLPVEQKRLFLEAVLDSIDITDFDLCTQMMQKAMELLGKPLPKLDDETYLSQTETFQDAYEYILEEDKPEAIPSLSINDHFYPNNIPSLDFIEKKIGSL